MSKALRAIQRRKKARNRLYEVMDDPEHVVVIHYSCESFYDRPDGTSPRITSIAVANLESNQTHSFSIHQIAEREKTSAENIEDNYDQLERKMLDEFYEYARAHAEHKWLHWNMRNIHYGFQAIAHRYRVLGGDPYEFHEANLVDLPRILYSIHGPRYIGHPRFQCLVELNRISNLDFLSGAEEAEAFENGEYVRLHYSTLRKVDCIANIALRADNGSLKTNATWKDHFILYPQGIGEWLKEHWVAQIILAIIAIVGLVLGILALF